MTAGECGMRRVAAPAYRVAALLAAAIAAAAWMSGCADISQKFAATASQAPYIGLPENAPARPPTPAAYPAVHDMPVPRNNVTLTNFEQKKLEEDLVAERQAQESKVGMAAKKGKKDKPPRPAERRSGHQPGLDLLGSSQSVLQVPFPDWDNR